MILGINEAQIVLTLPVVEAKVTTHLVVVIAKVTTLNRDIDCLKEATYV